MYTVKGGNIFNIKTVGYDWQIHQKYKYYNLISNNFKFKTTQNAFVVKKPAVGITIRQLFIMEAVLVISHTYVHVYRTTQTLYTKYVHSNKKYKLSVYLLMMYTCKTG